jgi:hypothetical protein
LVKGQLLGVPPSQVPATPQLVTEIRAMQLGGPGRELSRLEVVFADDVDYTMEADGNSLRLAAVRRIKGAQPLVAKANPPSTPADKGANPPALAGASAVPILSPPVAKAPDEDGRLAQEKADRERLAMAKAEQARLAQEQAEQERLAQEKAEQERLEKGRLEMLKRQAFRAEAVSQAPTDSKAEDAAWGGQAESPPDPSPRRGEDEGFGGESAAATAQPATVEEPDEPVGTDVSGEPRVMTFVGFKNIGEQSVVVVRTNDRVAFNVRKVGQNQIMIELENTCILVRNNQRPLDTSFFPRTAVRMISPEEQEGAGRSVRILVDLAEEVPYAPRQEGNLVTVSFQRPAG